MCSSSMGGDRKTQQQHKGILRGLKDFLSNTSLSQQGTQATMEAYMSDSAPSWEELSAMVAQQKQDAFGDHPEDGVNGPPNPFALKRMFGQNEEPVVKLYRDHAAWCPYCHKVVLQLEEKKIPYVIEKINMRCYGDKPAGTGAGIS